jgi:hypothetical protein
MPLEAGRFVLVDLTNVSPTCHPPTGGYLILTHYIPAGSINMFT